MSKLYVRKNSKIIFILLFTSVLVLTSVSIVPVTVQ
jgi:hypothetical protein